MKNITNTCDTHHPALSNFNICYLFRGFFWTLQTQMKYIVYPSPIPFPLPPSPEGTTIQNLSSLPMHIFSTINSYVCIHKQFVTLFAFDLFCKYLISTQYVLGTVVGAGIENKYMPSPSSCLQSFQNFI